MGSFVIVGILKLANCETAARCVLRLAARLAHDDRAGSEVRRRETDDWRWEDGMMWPWKKKQRAGVERACLCRYLGRLPVLAGGTGIVGSRGQEGAQTNGPEASLARTNVNTSLTSEPVTREWTPSSMLSVDTLDQKIERTGKPDGPHRRPATILPGSSTYALIRSPHRAHSAPSTTR